MKIMNPEAKATWLKELRSGKYNQGRGRLRQRRKGDTCEQHCCLGVLLDAIGEPSVREETPYGQTSEIEVVFRYHGDASVLPEEVAKRLNLDENAVWSLVEMNDNKRLSFAQIADYIEEEL